MEIQYELLSYGIPIAALPIDFNGEWHTKHHQAWVQRQFDLMQQSRLQGQQNQIFQAFDSIDVTNLIEGDENDVDSLFGSDDGVGVNDIVGDAYVTDTLEAGDDMFIATTVPSSVAPSLPGQFDLRQIEPIPTEQPSPQRPVEVSSAPHVTAAIVTNGLDMNSKAAATTKSKPPKVTKLSSVSSTRAGPTGTRQMKPNPSPNDVLLGKRGKAIWKQQAGNKLYMQLMEMYFESYENAPKFRKQEIGDLIISKIYDSGGAFLNYDNDTGCYFELDDEQVLREKVSSLFRNKRRDVNNLRKKNAQNKSK